MSKQKSIMSFLKSSSLVGKRPHLDSSNMISKKVKANDVANDVTSDSSVTEYGDNQRNNTLVDNEENCNSNIQCEVKPKEDASIGTDNISNHENQFHVTKAQKQTIEQNKMRAQIKLLSKKFTIVDSEMGISWYQALEKEFIKPYFEKLNAFVSHEYNNSKVYPPKEKIWTWTKACGVNEVKVVILGQDPYHNPGQAHGLCFSVPPGVKKPPSLVNIFKEIKNDCNVECDNFDNGNLEGWAAQGVLLLNAVLTVQQNKPNSHQDKGWEQLTTAVIKYLNDNSTGIVFLLWGAYAIKKANFVDAKKHHVLKAAHPSPLSAYKGFFGCQHFSKCNELLKKQGKSEINWTVLPPDKMKFSST